MPEIAAHEATTDEEIQQWHDQAYAEYEEALNAYMEDCAIRRKRGEPDTVDEDLLAMYEETRDNLSAGTQYWRQVGEQVGNRTGVVITGDES